MLVFLSSVGVAGWEAIVYPSPGAAASDSPLPLALSKITGTEGLIYHLLITIGLMGLVASFHGIILAASRATLEFGRVRYLPAVWEGTYPQADAGQRAAGEYGIGIIALLSGRTGEIITISVFGALTLYVLPWSRCWRCGERSRGWSGLSEYLSIRFSR